MARLPRCYVKSEFPNQCGMLLWRGEGMYDSFLGGPKHHGSNWGHHLFQPLWCLPNPSPAIANSFTNDSFVPHYCSLCSPHHWFSLPVIAPGKVNWQQSVVKKAGVAVEVGKHEVSSCSTWRWGKRGGGGYKWSVELVEGWMMWEHPTFLRWGVNLQG